MMGTYMTSCGGAAELRWADVALVAVLACTPPPSRAFPLACGGDVRVSRGN